jgi:Methyltransferase domain
MLSAGITFWTIAVPPAAATKHDATPNDLTPAELADLTRLARRAIWAPQATRAALQAARVNITPANFYATIPSVAEVEASFEYAAPFQEHYNGGLFDPERMQAEIGALTRFAAEFDPPVDGDREAPAGFFWDNPAFSYSDAMAYYAMIRRLKPAGIVEIGSGFSTLVADAALRANGHGTLTLIEPYPKPFLRALPTVSELIEAPVQSIPVDRLTQMIEAAGLWFIDSTHTVKTGSDCLWMYLKVMPQLACDVVIHAHDIFLPYGFPRRQILNKHIYWTEQYLLYAYLLDNPRAEVLFSSAYAAKALPEATLQLMHGRWAGGGGSLWFRLKPPGKTNDSGSETPA